ncbi:MAG: 1-acyl-sn-glycerol-3-phosphate acyltransferase [Oscillospiraceae bacterium]|nr:1-acyl-sn-glycerol-3-phosphate acyltransferase [Oscillospiraceae bacterium]
MYKVIYVLFMPVFRLLYRVRITGRENVPEAAAVVCANHTSMLDPIFLCIAFGLKTNWSFMAKAELMKIPVLGSFLRALGVIGVNRGATDISTLRNAIASLNEGKKLMIFPEGTRVHGEADVSGAKNGAAMIACRAKTDMIPVYVKSPRHLFGKGEVIVGKPITPEAEGTGAAKYKAVVEKVFGEILSLGNGGEK